MLFELRDDTDAVVWEGNTRPPHNVDLSAGVYRLLKNCGSITVADVPVATARRVRFASTTKRAPKPPAEATAMRTGADTDTRTAAPQGGLLSRFRS